MGCYVDRAPVDIITDTTTDIFTYTCTCMQWAWHPVRYRIPAEHLVGNLSNRKICDGNTKRMWELLPSEVLPAPLPAMATRHGQGKWLICCCGKNISENLLFISLNHNFWRYFNLKGLVNKLPTVYGKVFLFWESSAFCEDFISNNN